MVTTAHWTVIGILLFYTIGKKVHSGATLNIALRVHFFCRESCIRIWNRGTLWSDSNFLVFGPVYRTRSPPPTPRSLASVRFLPLKHAWASKAGGTGDASHAVEKSAGDVSPEMMIFQYLFSWYIWKFCVSQHFQKKVAEIRGETKFWG